MGILGKIFTSAGKFLGKSAAKCEFYAARYGAKGVKQAANSTTRVANVPNMFDVIKAKADAMPLALPAPTAEKLIASRPKLNTGKLFGYGSDQLHMSQKITKDGTHIRYYRKPGSNKISLKTADKGILHQEWAYGDRAGELTYLKNVGNDMYLLRKRDGYTQIAKQSQKYKDGINQTVGSETLIGNGMKRTQVREPNGSIQDKLQLNYIGKYGTSGQLTFPVNSKSNRVNYNSLQVSNDSKLLYDLAPQRYAAKDEFLKRPLGLLEDLLSPFKK